MKNVEIIRHYTVCLGKALCLGYQKVSGSVIVILLNLAHTRFPIVAEENSLKGLSKSVLLVCGVYKIEKILVLV